MASKSVDIETFLDPRFPSRIGKLPLQTIRTIAVIPCIIISILTMWKFPLSLQLMFITMLANTFTIATTILSVYVASVQGWKPLEKVRLWLHRSTQFTMGFQVMNILAYWAAIRRTLTVQEAYTSDPWLLLTLDFVHTFPILCVTLNVVLSNIRFEMREFWHTSAAVAVIMLMNFVGTLIAGHPFYPNLDWQSFASVITAATFVALFTASYVVTAFLVNLLPRQKAGEDYASL